MSKRNILIILGIAIALAIGGYLVFFGNHSVDKGAKPHATSTIVAYGDSLIAGLGSTPGNDLVSVLSRMADQPIINLGKSGDTTADGLARVGEALSRKPDIVIILLGGNDFLQRIPISTTFTNLENIISRFQAEGTHVILLGVQGGILSDSYRGHFEELARKMDIPYVPNVVNGIIGHPDLMSDYIHPNDKGYYKIAEKVYPILENELE